MKTWILKDEWVFHIFERKSGKGFKVVTSNVDRRDRALARRLARIISAAFNARRA